MDTPYLYSILALRVGRTGLEVCHRAGQVTAPTAEEAAALALRRARRLFPEIEGFAHHSVALCSAQATSGASVSVIALDD